MMVALGEMATLYPDSGSFTNFATRFLDPALGFATGCECFRVCSCCPERELVSQESLCKQEQGVGLNLVCPRELLVQLRSHDPHRAHRRCDRRECLALALYVLQDG